jgi:hypothetical protein
MHGKRLAIGCVAALALPIVGSLLAGELRQLHVAAGEAPLCRTGVSLGRMSIVTTTAWRADQKEPDWRYALWTSALRKSGGVSCASSISSGLSDPGLTDGSAIASAGATGDVIDTVVLIRSYEAGPNLQFGLFPPHWLGWTEAEFGVRALEVSSGALLYDAHVRLARGGLFALRGEAAVRRDAFDALELVLGAELMSEDARLGVSGGLR